MFNVCLYIVVCLVIFYFITGITRGLHWYHDSSYWTVNIIVCPSWEEPPRHVNNFAVLLVNIRSLTVEECEEVMSTLRKEHIGNKWNIWLELLSPIVY